MTHTAERRRELAGQPSQIAPAILALAALEHPAKLPPIPQPKTWSDTQEEMMLWMVATHLSEDSAASCVGISGTTLSLWRTYASQYDNNDPDTPVIGAACRALLDRLKRAWDYAEQATLAKIGTFNAWQAHAWLLERTRQSKYALQNVAQTGQVTINIGLALGVGADPQRVQVSVEQAKPLPDPRRNTIDVQPLEQQQLRPANP